MKTIIHLVVLLVMMATACKMNNNSSSVSRTFSGGGSYGEPSYLRDRRQDQYSTSRTNAHGASGPGSGASYAGSSYRQSAIEANNDTTPDPINQYLRIWGREDLAADTVDKGISW